MSNHKLINECIDCEHLCNIFKPRHLIYDLRNPRTFEEERFTSNYILHSTMPRLIRTWHNLPNGIKTITELPDFKNIVKKEILMYS